MSIQQLLEGQYKLIQSIGNGGSSHTFIARSISNPSLPQCVIRHFKPANTQPEFIDKVRLFFEKQVGILDKLGKHDQVPQLISGFEKENQFFVVQEFIEGQSLADEIKAVLPHHHTHFDSDGHKLEKGNTSTDNVDNLQKDKCLSETEVIKILLDVLNVLDFLHSEGVIHYDIQPNNLIRRKKDQKIMLINLGALQEMQDANAQLKLNEKGEPYFPVTIGTPGYTPSEQCAGRPTHSSDIYALGMVAIKALTGYNPVDFSSDPETGELVWREKAQVSNRLVQIVTRMIRYHYTQRYQSAKEVTQELIELSKQIERENKAIAAKMLSSKYSLNSDNKLQSQRYRASSSKTSSIVLFGVLMTVFVAISVFIMPIILRGKIANKIDQSKTISQNPNIPTEPLVQATTASNSPQQQPASPNSESLGETVNKVLNLEPNQETVLANKIQANGTHTYTFQARNGQVINANVKGNNVSMSLLNAKGVAMLGAENVPLANIIIPEDGAYIIQLKGTSNGEAVNYQLNVGLKDFSVPKAVIASPLAPKSPTNLTASASPVTTTSNPPISTTLVSPVPTVSNSPVSAPPEPQPPQIEIKVRKK